MTEFNPQEHLIITDGRAYLPTAARLLWFRERYPHGRIETASVGTSGHGPIMKATVTAVNADGAIEGVASGHGFALWDSPYSPAETAETKAIGRALAALGFGTQFTGLDFDDSHALADSPVTATGGSRVRHKETHRSASVQVQGYPHGGTTQAVDDGPPPMPEPDDVSDADYMAGYGEPAPRRTVDDLRPKREPAENVLEPTERQRKLVGVLVDQLNLDDNELRALCREATGKEFAEVDRRSISELITALQRRKQEGQEASQAI